MEGSSSNGAVGSGSFTRQRMEGSSSNGAVGSGSFTRQRMEGSSSNGAVGSGSFTRQRMEGSSSNGAVGSGSFTRQLKGRDIWNSSKRWRKKGPKKSLEQIEGLEMASGNGLVLRKKVMVLVDQSTCAKDAVMWALTHVVNKRDHLTLLEIIPLRKDQRKTLSTSGSSSSAASADSAESLVSVCKNFRPEVEVHALAIQGPKLPTVIFQVKKLQVSVLVLGQKKPPPVNWLCSLYRSSSEDFVEQCISNAECLTVAVRKQSRDVGGYLISTRWQKNFWLLA